MKEFRPPEEPALCADSSAGVPLVYSLTFSWSNRSIEMSFLAYITVISATPSRRLVFRLRTRHIESPSGLRGIVYLLAPLLGSLHSFHQGRVRLPQVPASNLVLLHQLALLILL